jgi:hypothetical protein
MIETKTDEAYQLGTWVGRKQAFATLAGRCSAADAECLRQARESKHYRRLGMNWEQFCQRRMGMSRASADRLIALLQEFGPQYFVLAHATGITAEQYRRIGGAVQGQALLHAGEAIPINAENAPRLAAAVEALRRAPAVGEDATVDASDEAAVAEARAQAEIERAFERAARGAKVALAQFQRLVEMHREGRSRRRLIGELGYVIAKLKEVEQASWKCPTESRTE